MRRLVGLARRVGRRLQALARPSRPVMTLPLTPGPPQRLLADVWCAPVHGLMLNDYGQVFANPDQGAVDPASLTRLPNTHERDEEVRFAPPVDVPRLEAATLFMDGRAAHNYACFLLEALPALLAAHEAGVLEGRPAIAPPLTPWQAQLLALAGAPTPTAVEAALVRVAAGAFAPAPDAARLDRTRTRILSALDPAPAGPPRLYLSRRDSRQAVMADEAALETLLADRGFTIVRPETSSVRDLATLFRDAELIVASGTILANLLFCSPGARVVELQPPGPPQVWGQDLARHGGLAWRAYAPSGPAQVDEILLQPDPRPASAFAWRLDVSAFAAVLDAMEAQA